MAVTVGIMIGSGIFRVPAAAAAQTGSAEVMLAAWVVGGMVALCGALSLAEVAALYPGRAGSTCICARRTDRSPRFCSAGCISSSYRPARARSRWCSPSTWGDWYR